MSNKTKVQMYDSYYGLLNEMNLGMLILCQKQTFKYVGIQLTARVYLCIQICKLYNFNY